MFLCVFVAGLLCFYVFLSTGLDEFAAAGCFGDFGGKATCRMFAMFSYSVLIRAAMASAVWNSSYETLNGNAKEVVAMKGEEWME